MKSIRITEIFSSFQGEIDVGVPSVFIRSAGCNFRCRGFGMSDGELSDEGKNLNPADYDTIDQIPVPKTGCDTAPAIWPKLIKKFSPPMTTSDIADKVIALLPNGKFERNAQLVITGGEPLLGWQDAWVELFDTLADRAGLDSITIETNGTQILSGDLLYYVRQQVYNFKFSVSVKLSSSGEPFEKRFNPEAVLSCVATDLPHLTRFKFVVSDLIDVVEVSHMMDKFEAYSKVFKQVPVYLMPVGADADMYGKNEKNVAVLAAIYGYSFTPRLQVGLYGNKWGT